MGRTNGAISILKKNLFLTIAAISAVIGITSPVVMGGAEELRGLKTFNAKLPIYHKNRLQFLISSKEIIKNADKIMSKDTIIDIIRKGADIDKIKYLDNIVPYPLGYPLVEVIKFWSDKPYSEGFITSSEALIDQGNKTASGQKKVYMRSPALDLDGIGFVANYGNKTVKIGRDVNIVIRTAAAQKRELSSKSKESSVRVKADSMLADFEKGTITLFDNIHVDEARATITCDKIVIMLNKKEKSTKELKADEPPATGVSKLTCIGNVVISRKLSAEELKKNGAQKALADKAVYDTVKERIVLSGKKPSIMRGRDYITGKEIVMWKNSERMQVTKNCQISMHVPRKAKDIDPDQPTLVNSDFMDLNYGGNIATFTGNVRIKDPMLNVDCHKMTIYLEDRPGNKKQPKVAKAVGIVPETKLASGSKDVNRIICVGDVVVIKNKAKVSAPEERALAGRAVYNLKESKIILSKNNPIIIRGRDSISGKKVVVWLDQERMIVDNNSKIVLNSMRTGKLKAKGSTVVTSDSTDLNYGKNVLAFTGNVKVKDPAMSLDCSRMKIFLEGESKAAKNKKVDVTDPLAGLQSGGKKEVAKVVCVGDVHADDPKATLDCDKMILTFRDRPANSKGMAAAGPFGSDSNREINLITCEGNVRLTNKPKKQAQSKKAKVSGDDDFKKMAEKNPLGKAVVTANKAVINVPGNIAHLTGNVAINEPRIQLTCSEMDLIAESAAPEKIVKSENYGDVSYEGEVPRRISIGSDRDLKEIICRKNVVIVRKDIAGETQRALGDKAVYKVSDRKIVLSGTKQKPTLQRGENIMEGDLITLWTDSEKLDVKNGRLKILNMDQLQD
jgi:lipopolysaccharide export system protein LptA